ncbi:MAG: flagellar basal-body rod protein FlgG [Bdellovibrionales bacterium]
MLKALNTAATGMQAQQTNMDVTANNMANLSTNGYKKARAEFEDLMYQTIKEPGAVSGDNAVSPVGVQTGLGVKTSAIKKDFTTGAAKITQKPLDVMVEGKGFFAVQTPNGVSYTRDGAFSKNAQGVIVNRAGFPLEPALSIPSNALGLSISPNGQVEVEVPGGQRQNIGQIELSNFVNPAGLKAIGKNLYTQTAASGVPQVGLPGQNGLGELSQGQLEGSNVNIVDEMVNMITTQRAYEMNSKAIQAADQMLQAINNLR